MKASLTLISLILMCSQAYAANFSCRYTDPDNNTGSVSVSVYNDTLTAKFKRRTYKSHGCSVDRTLASEILVACDENPGNRMGFMATETNGNIEGYLIIEKIVFFGELNCK